MVSRLIQSEENRIKHIIYGNLDRLFEELDDLNDDKEKEESDL